MKLTDLDPRWVGAGGEGIFNRGPDGEPVPAPERHGVGVMLNCPCGGTAQEDGRRCVLYVPFKNPLDGGASLEPRGWDRSGDTFETLTLSPSILRSKERGGCGWHGWIRNGEIITA